MLSPDQHHLTDRQGMLFIEDTGATGIAHEFGTPVYVTSEARLRENYRRLHSAFASLKKEFSIHYAVKANSNLAIMKILREEGAGADCASPAEIYFAGLAGFERERTIYSGNYNSDTELQTALESGVIINLDDGPLLRRLIKFGMPGLISFRINPGTGKGRYAGITTAGPDAKFGMMEREALAAYREARDAGISRFGMHMMTGSNVLEADYFSLVTGKLMDTASKISAELGISFEFIDIGGGFGVPYEPGERELDIKRVARGVVDVFNRTLDSSRSMGNPALVIEPGRYLVADTTVLLSTVTYVKHSVKTFVGCDAGMNVLLRPALYGAYHEILVANKMDLPLTETADITGQICENTDVMAKERKICNVEAGDVLAIMNAGAYGFSMASRYNGRPLPPEVLVSGNRVRLIREREDIADMLRTQEIHRNSL
jgi:diaminopimelate decarboxylase